MGAQAGGEDLLSMALQRVKQLEMQMMVSAPSAPSPLQRSNGHETWAALKKSTCFHFTYVQLLILLSLFFGITI